MGDRADLHTLLLGITANVYFQPPSTTKMEYPCIVYRREPASTDFADDKPYSYRKRYQVVVIDRNPDSDLPDKVAALPMCVHDRYYAADQLNHDVFKIFF